MQLRSQAFQVSLQLRSQRDRLRQQVFIRTAQCLADSNDAAAQKAAEQAEQVSENDTPVVASEYTDIAIAQVDNYVNVRSEPNTDSEVLGKLYNNSAGTILETTDNGWYRIKSGNVDGYVKCEYVVPNDEDWQKKVSTKYAKVNTTTLHVRTEPSTDASILTQVPVGDDLVVIDDESVEDWAKVTTEEGDGWVHKDYVDFNIEFVQAESKEEEKQDLQKKRQSVRQLMQQQMQQERKLTGSHLLQRAPEVQRVMRQQEAQMDRQLQVMHHSLSVILMYTVEPV